MDSPTLSIDAVNALGEAEFVEQFGSIYESSPHLAAAAWSHRPFADRAALVAAFDAVAAGLGDEAGLDLLRAHPVLGQRGPMAPASQDEQASAGLTSIEDARRERLRADNATYLERFGFPFIIAVRGLSVADIDDALARRLGGDPADERRTALEQVRRIAALRLEQRVEA